MSKLQREKCGSCSKEIYLGQSITECANCNQSVIHTKCFKKSVFKKRNGAFYCSTCLTLVPERYNPFRELADIDPRTDHEDDSDKFFDQNIGQYTGDLLEASKVLEGCKYYSAIAANDLMPLNSKKLNTYFYNIDGNRSNFDTFAAEINPLKAKLSLIGLVETNVDADQKGLFQLDHFNSFYSDKLPGKSSGTGVALYTHEMFNTTINEQACIVVPHLESFFVTMTNSGVAISAGVVYRPPNSSFKDFLYEFEKVIRGLPKTVTYILGDFNLNLLKSDSNANVEAFENMLIAEGLYPVISLATHKRSTHDASCIDNIITNNIDCITHSGIIADQGTAHSPIFSISCSDFGVSPQTKIKQTQYYSFSKGNTDKLLEILKDNHAGLIGSDHNKPDFNSCFETFSKSIDAACKLSVPKNTVRNAINNPWITDGVINSIETKAKLYDEWKSSCTKSNPSGDEQLHLKYSIYRRELKHIIKYVKAKFYNSKFMNASGEPKKTWEIINQIRGKRKKTIKPQFVIDNKKIYERRVIANEFNKYFVSLASKLNDETTKTSSNKSENFLPPRNMHSMFLYVCSEEEVAKVISELQNGKSSDIPISVIKKVSPIISPVLARHFNYLMGIGKFPDQLKLGKITPIYKKEDEELMQNYRPISTLPIFGKIFEKIIFSRLYNFFVSQGLLHSKQFGFRKNHSTSHALNYSISQIKSALRRGDHVLGIFIDLSKAFDTIDHDILLKKLEHYGVRGQPLALLKSYLSDRSQCVNVLGETSEILPIIYGVPQGSCLGPLLFLIYINDLGKISQDSELILFADDTNIFVKASSKALVYKNANLILEKISNYMICNKLHINLGKCCYMYFSNTSKKTEEVDSDEKYILKIDDTPLNPVTETKFLGVLIDEGLTWEPHIRALAKKLACCTGSLNRIIQFVPENLHESLYYTLFESYLTYAISVWGEASKAKLKPLIKAQKKVIRVMFGDREKFLDKFMTCARARPISAQKLSTEFFIKEHTKPLFNTHNILTLQNLYFYHSSCEVFKIFKFHTPIALYELYSFSNRGHKNLFLITPQPSSCYIYRTSVMFNSVRQNLSITDTSVSVMTLKLRLKKFLLTKQLIGEQDSWNDLNFFEF